MDSEYLRVCELVWAKTEVASAETSSCSVFEYIEKRKKQQIVLSEEVLTTQTFSKLVFPQRRSLDLIFFLMCSNEMVKGRVESAGWTAVWGRCV